MRKDFTMTGPGINKGDFFRTLDDLEDLSDDGQNAQSAGDIAGLIRRSNTAPTTLTRSSTEHKEDDMLPSAPLKRHSSMVPPSVTKKSSMKPSSAFKSETLMKRGADPFQPEEPKGRKKRRTQSVQIIPESDQIFKGLKFFFVPNNDISPARRLRIQRSQEYGALWAQEWSADVTHVIVDKGLDYKELLKVLTPEQLSINIAIVNQDYISDCLAFKSILLVTQLRFRVAGTPKTPETDKAAPALAPAATTATKNTKSSLKVKESGRQRRRSVTPSRSEDTPVGNPNLMAEQQEADVVSFSKEEQRKPDLLDELMIRVKAAGELPLDEPDDEAALDITLDNSSEEGPSDEAATLTNDRVPSWQRTFACMQQHDGNSINDNPNFKTIEILQRMADYYDRIADTWRTMAYRKAITALRKERTKICTKAEALAIPGIGQRLADKVEEIVSTDRLRRLENINWTPEDRALQLFLGIYGAGFTQASKWVAQGYRSLEDLQDKAELTVNQKIGVEHYHDFQQRIPRAEVTQHGEIVRAAVHALDPHMEVMVAGSYRRGAAHCGDIDVLITKTNGTIEYIRTLMMDNVVPELTRKGFLKVSLATTSRGDGSKWHGASALPDTNIWRRIDLLFVPGDEIGAALLYFTGNDIFNRSVRLLARKKGMRLNQHGLYKDVLRGPNQVKLTDGTLLESRDEKRIFEILGVPWRPPQHRIC